MLKENPPARDEKVRCNATASRSLVEGKAFCSCKNSRSRLRAITACLFTLRSTLQPADYRHNSHFFLARTRCSENTAVTFSNICLIIGSYQTCVSQIDTINLYETCVLYIGLAYRYPPDVAFYIFFFNKYKY